jgi:hypothetical protein
MTAETYRGSCQCGAVAFEARLDISEPLTCNCSRCRRLGSRLAFAPREAFALLQGADNLTEYTFNHHVIRHQFCRTCGVQPFSYGQMPDGTPTVAVNVNCLEGVDPSALPTRQFDGASL